MPASSQATSRPRCTGATKPATRPTTAPERFASWPTRRAAQGEPPAGGGHRPRWLELLPTPDTSDTRPDDSDGGDDAPSDDLDEFLDLVVGETTYDGIKDMATLELDLIQVKGKTVPVRIFTLVGDEAVSLLEWRELEVIG